MAVTHKSVKKTKIKSQAALSAPRDLSQLPVREMEENKKPALSGIDQPFLILVLLLQAVGIIALTSASYADAYYYISGRLG